MPAQLSERTQCAAIGALRAVTARAAPGRPKPRALTNRKQTASPIAKRLRLTRFAYELNPKPAYKPGSVTAQECAMAVIPLGATLPLRSCHLPADSASSVIVRLLGVAPDGGCRVSPAFP